MSTPWISLFLVFFLFSGIGYGASMENDLAGISVEDLKIEDYAALVESYEEYQSFKGPGVANTQAWSRVERKHRGNVILYILLTLAEKKFPLTDDALSKAEEDDLTRRGINLDIEDVTKLYSRSRGSFGNFPNALKTLAALRVLKKPAQAPPFSKDEGLPTDLPVEDYLPDLIRELASAQAEEKILLAVDYYNEQKRLHGMTAAWRGLSERDQLRLLFFQITHLLMRSYPVTYESLRHADPQKLVDHNVTLDIRDVNNLYNRGNQTVDGGFLVLRDLSILFLIEQENSGIKEGGLDPSLLADMGSHRLSRVGEDLIYPSESQIDQFVQSYQKASRQAGAGKSPVAWKKLSPIKRVGILLYQAHLINRDQPLGEIPSRFDFTSLKVDLDQDDLKAFMERVRSAFPGGRQGLQELIQTPYWLNSLAFKILGTTAEAPVEDEETQKSLDRYKIQRQQTCDSNEAWSLLTQRDHFLLLRHHYLILKKAGMTWGPGLLRYLPDAVVSHVPIDRKDAVLFYGRLQELLKFSSNVNLEPDQYLAQIIGKDLPRKLRPTRLATGKKEMEEKAEPQAPVMESLDASDEQREAGLAETDADDVRRRAAEFGPRLEVESDKEPQTAQDDVLEPPASAPRMSFDPQSLSDKRYSKLTNDEDRRAHLSAQILYLLQKEFVPSPQTLVEITAEQRAASHIYFNPALILARSYDLYGKEGYPAAIENAGFSFDHIMRLDRDLRENKCAGLIGA